MSRRSFGLPCDRRHHRGGHRIVGLLGQPETRKEQMTAATWETFWRPGARRLSDEQLDKILEGCTNTDYPKIMTPLVVLSYPSIAFGGTRMNMDGTFQGTGVLNPCAHPIQLRAQTLEALEWVMATGLPVRCSYCIAEAELDGTN